MSRRKILLDDMALPGDVIERSRDDGETWERVFLIDNDPSARADPIDYEAGYAPAVYRLVRPLKVRVL